MAKIAQSLFAWPAHPSLTALHLVARVALVLINLVGLCVSFGAAAASGSASFWTTAAFMTASLIFFQPIFMVWNKRQLRRSKMVFFEDIPVAEDVRSAIASSPAHISTRFLEFAILMDTIGVLGYWIVWGFTLRDSLGGYWYWRSDGLTAAMTYSGAATLACALLHNFLFATQSLQLLNAYRARPTSKPVCPHCHHSLDEIPGSNNNRGGRRSPPVMTSVQPEEAENLLGRDSFNDAESDRQTVIDMAPGQETGTCAVTPRVSTSGGGPNTNEGDRLMEKSESGSTPHFVALN